MKASRISVGGLRIVGKFVMLFEKVEYFIYIIRINFFPVDKHFNTSKNWFCRYHNLLRMWIFIRINVKLIRNCMSWYWDIFSFYSWGIMRLSYVYRKLHNRYTMRINWNSSGSIGIARRWSRNETESKNGKLNLQLLSPFFCVLREVRW